MAFIPLHNTPLQFMDNNGDPLTSGTLEFFLAETTTTTELFSDDAGTSIGVTITLNSWGMPESGGATISLFRDDTKAIKIVGKNAAGATIWTHDNIPAVASFNQAASDKLDAIEALADVTDYANVKAAGALMVDGTTSMTGDLAFDTDSYVKWSVSAALVASTTQTQAGAVALTAGVCEVATVANANDAVVMPAAVAGRQLILMNNGANTLQIFPLSGDAFNVGAVDASTTLATVTNATYVCFTDVIWETL